MNSGLWFGLVLLPWTSACTHVILTCCDTCRDVGTIQHRQILQNLSLVCRNVKFQYLFFCDWVGPNPGWTSPVEQLREGHHRLFLKWDVPCMKHSLMLVSASAHIQQTDVSFVWFTYVSIHCIILHLINTSCVLTHHISLHIIQSKACKTLWCTAVLPPSPLFLLMLLLRRFSSWFVSFLSSSSRLSACDRLPPCLPLFPSLSLVTASDLQQPSTETASWTSISFRGSFSISGWIQNQGSELNNEITLDWRKKTTGGKTGARDGWRRVDVESVMCGCVDVLIWSPLTFCENMNKWSGDTVCVCIALLLFLSSRLLDGDLLFSDLLLHSLVHLFLHPFTWWII